MRSAVAKCEMDKVQRFGEFLTHREMQAETTAHQTQIERQHVCRLSLVDRRFDQRLGPTGTEHVAERREVHA